MIERSALPRLLSLMHEFPAVAVLGPRQVGKTTLARRAAAEFPGSVYLDLERPSDLRRLDEAELYLGSLAGRLVVIDEVQRRPDLFPVLRSLIDERRSAGARAGQFLLLGSASLDLVSGSAESLAGRVAYLELAPFHLGETGAASADRLWLRGGYPESYLARDDAASLRWRQAFVRTYLERDVPAFAPRVPAETLRRLWTMLANGQGSLLNLSRIAAGLGISVPTVGRYLDLLVDLLLVRRLAPWHANIGKRLVRSPKIYLRDSGLLHALLDLETLHDLAGHPVVGASWEGFAIDTIAAGLPDGATLWFYRTAAGAEAELVVESGRSRRVVVEIKRSAAPTVGRGFRHAIDDVGADDGIVVYPGDETWPITSEIAAVPLDRAVARIVGG